jgi:hypothetical protein
MVLVTFKKSSLIVASQYQPESVLEVLLKYVRGSRPVIVFHIHKEVSDILGIMHLWRSIVLIRYSHPRIGSRACLCIYADVQRVSKLGDYGELDARIPIAAGSYPSRDDHVRRRRVHIISHSRRSRSRASRLCDAVPRSLFGHFEHATHDQLHHG